MEKFSQSFSITKLDVLCSLHNSRFMREASLTRHFTRSARQLANREMMGGENKFFSSPSSRASGKMPRSPRFAHKASVMEAKSSVHRLVFIVFKYNFSAFLLQKFSV